jgi:hypothetical protein
MHVYIEWFHIVNVVNIIFFVCQRRTKDFDIGDVHDVILMMICDVTPARNLGISHVPIGDPFLVWL